MQYIPCNQRFDGYPFLRKKITQCFALIIATDLQKNVLKEGHITLTLSLLKFPFFLRLCCFSVVVITVYNGDKGVHVRMVIHF